MSKCKKCEGRGYYQLYEDDQDWCGFTRACDCEAGRKFKLRMIAGEEREIKRKQAKIARMKAAL